MKWEYHKDYIILPLHSKTKLHVTPQEQEPLVEPSPSHPREVSSIDVKKGLTTGAMVSTESTVWLPTWRMY